MQAVAPIVKPAIGRTCGHVILCILKIYMTVV